MLRVSPTGTVSEAEGLGASAFFSHSSLAWDGKGHALLSHAYPSWFMPTREKQLGAVLLSDLAGPGEPPDAGAAGDVAPGYDDAGISPDASTHPAEGDGGAEVETDDAGTTWPGGSILGPHAPIAPSLPLPESTDPGEGAPSSHAHGGCSVAHQGEQHGHTLSSILTVLSLLTLARRNRRRATDVLHLRAS